MKIGTTVAYARVKYNPIPTVDDYVKFVEWAGQVGFGGFELAAFTLDHFRRDFLDRAKLRRLVERYKSLGKYCDAFEAGFLRNMMLDPSPQAEAELLTHVRNIADVARFLETDLVYGHTAPHPSWKIKWKKLYDEYTPPSSISVPEDFSWKTSWDKYVERTKKVVEVAEQSGVLFAFEIRPYEMVSNSDSMVAFMKAVGSKNLGLVFDTAHFFVQKEILPIALEKLKGSVFLIHLADNDGCSDYHWAPGKGNVDWENFLRAVRRIGYDRFLNIDVAGTYRNIASQIVQGRNYITKLANRT